ncbi:MAG TPA: lytic murein transglycosylase, partial [Candidatus Paceibacterota bacterium]|nr:lytic murein transglycosylase [Candidatus Paceibacterota bacterium]
LATDIGAKSSTLSDLEGQLSQNQQTLAALLRKAAQAQNVSLLELLTNGTPLNQIFEEADAEEILKENINSVMESTKTLASSTESARSALQTQEDSETDAKQALQYQENLVKNNQAQLDALLAQSKQTQETYQTFVDSLQSRIDQIKAQLFQLSGGGAAIPFGAALTYAQTVESQTGVDPAFLLAIIQQESNLGSNVGKCYLTDTTSGAGINVSTGNTFPNVMKPSRDIQPFLAITKSLGFDPLKTVVSCPIPSAGGYGGAMGPAQFIPSTWTIYISRIASALNISVPNPWNPPDAFMAAGLYFEDLGAKGTISNSYTINRTAACHYYSGENCYASNGSANVGLSYGDSVMTRAENIQECMINPIEHPEDGIPSGC